MAVADVDLEKLMVERRRSNTWRAGEWCVSHLQTIDFSFTETGEVLLLPASPPRMCRIAPRPAHRGYGLLLTRPRCCAPHRARRSCPRPVRRAACCEEIWTCRPPVSRRARPYRYPLAVIGLSGGLIPRSPCSSRCAPSISVARTVHAVSMPGFGTTGRTKSNAEPGRAIGRRLRTIAIGEAVRAHFTDIGHDPSVTDVTYENAQARERTQVLMDLSNELGGFVIGTGDLSELALGWATYNADHMSMYGVNAGVPKTLVRHLVSHAADSLGGE
ncbi:MAG: NAD(+) synthase, partial [Collinsella intestinalis]